MRSCFVLFDTGFHVTQADLEFTMWLKMILTLLLLLPEYRGWEGLSFMNSSTGSSFAGHYFPKCSWCFCINFSHLLRSLPLVACLHIFQWPCPLITGSVNLPRVLQCYLQASTAILACLLLEFRSVISQPTREFPQQLVQAFAVLSLKYTYLNLDISSYVTLLFLEY